MENDAPHEHPCSAIGLLTIRNADRISSVWKSITEPFTYPREMSSITTFAPSFVKTLEKNEKGKL